MVCAFFSDKLFPALGFGAKVPPDGHISHELFLVSIVMVAIWNRADHYNFIFALSFVLSFFSSPNLSRCRLDVYHTSTHGVALVRI